MRAALEVQNDEYLQMTLYGSPSLGQIDVVDDFGLESTYSTSTSSIIIGTSSIIMGSAFPPASICEFPLFLASWSPEGAIVAELFSTCKT